MSQNQSINRLRSSSSVSPEIEGHSGWWKNLSNYQKNRPSILLKQRNSNFLKKDADSSTSITGDADWWKLLSHETIEFPEKSRQKSMSPDVDSEPEKIPEKKKLFAKKSNQKNRRRFSRILIDTTEKFDEIPQNSDSLELSLIDEPSIGKSTKKLFAKRRSTRVDQIPVDEISKNSETEIHSSKNFDEFPKCFVRLERMSHKKSSEKRRNYSSVDQIPFNEISKNSVTDESTKENLSKSENRRNSSKNFDEFPECFVRLSPTVLHEISEKHQNSSTEINVSKIDQFEAKTLFRKNSEKRRNYSEAFVDESTKDSRKRFDEINSESRRRTKRNRSKIDEDNVETPPRKFRRKFDRNSSPDSPEILTSTKLDFTRVKSVESLNVSTIDKIDDLKKSSKILSPTKLDFSENLTPTNLEKSKNRKSTHLEKKSKILSPSKLDFSENLTPTNLNKSENQKSTHLEKKSKILSPSKLDFLENLTPTNLNKSENQKSTRLEKKSKTLSPTKLDFLGNLKLTDLETSKNRNSADLEKSKNHTPSKNRRSTRLETSQSPKSADLEKSKIPTPSKIRISTRLEISKSPNSADLEKSKIPTPSKIRISTRLETSKSPKSADLEKSKNLTPSKIRSSTRLETLKSPNSIDLEKSKNQTPSKNRSTKLETSKSPKSGDLEKLKGHLTDLENVINLSSTFSKSRKSINLSPTSLETPKIPKSGDLEKSLISPDLETLRNLTRSALRKSKTPRSLEKSKSLDLETPSKILTPSKLNKLRSRISPDLEKLKNLTPRTRSSKTSKSPISTDLENSKKQTPTDLEKSKILTIKLRKLETPTSLEKSKNPESVDLENSKSEIFSDLEKSNDLEKTKLHIFSKLNLSPLNLEILKNQTPKKLDLEKSKNQTPTSTNLEKSKSPISTDLNRTPSKNLTFSKLEKSPRKSTILEKSERLASLLEDASKSPILRNSTPERRIDSTPKSLRKSTNQIENQSPDLGSKILSQKISEKSKTPSPEKLKILSPKESKKSKTYIRIISPKSPENSENGSLEKSKNTSKNVDEFRMSPKLLFNKNSEKRRNYSEAFVDESTIENGSKIDETNSEKRPSPKSRDSSKKLELTEKSNISSKNLDFDEIPLDQLSPKSIFNKNSGKRRNYSEAFVDELTIENTSKNPETSKNVDEVPLDIRRSPKSLDSSKKTELTEKSSISSKNLDFDEIPLDQLSPKSIFNKNSGKRRNYSEAFVDELTIENTSKTPETSKNVDEVPLDIRRSPKSLDSSKKPQLTENTNISSKNPDFDEIPLDQLSPKSIFNKNSGKRRNYSEAFVDESTIENTSKIDETNTEARRSNLRGASKSPEKSKSPDSSKKLIDKSNLSKNRTTSKLRKSLKHKLFETSIENNRKSILKSPSKKPNLIEKKSVMFSDTYTLHKPDSINSSTKSKNNLFDSDWSEKSLISSTKLFNQSEVISIESTVVNEIIDFDRNSRDKILLESIKSSADEGTLVISTKTTKITDFYDKTTKQKYEEAIKEKFHRSTKLKKRVTTCTKIGGKTYKPKKIFGGKRWCNQYLFKFLEKQMKEIYDDGVLYTKMNKLLQFMVESVEIVLKTKKNFIREVELLKEKLAQNNIIKTHFDFFRFVADYLPFEYRLKAVPKINPSTGKSNYEFDDALLYQDVC